ncbi:MAG: hypothetical protein WA945_04765 [Arcobacteraceae bacterium]
MGLKKYIIGSLLLAIIILGYTFSIASGDFRIQIFETTFLLPIAIWVILPMILLLVLTIIHIIFYGLKNHYIIKAVTKDSQSLISLINKRLQNETASFKFQNPNIKEIASIIEQLDIDVTNSNFSAEDKRMAQIVEQKFSIQSGKYIPSKELKLDKDNPLMIQNIKNRIMLDDNFALEVVKSPEKNSQEIVKFAFLKVLKSKSITSIKKIVEGLEFDNEMMVKLLKKDSEQKPEFAMTNDMILSLLKKVSLSTSELTTIAKDYTKSMTPDQVIQLFEKLSQEKEEYITVYLYVLAEYEMIDEIRDVLVNSAADEYIPFKALVDLKDAGKLTYSLDSISYK